MKFMAVKVHGHKHVQSQEGMRLSLESHPQQMRVCMSIKGAFPAQSNHVTLIECLVCCSEPHENVSHAELAGHYYADVATLDIQSDSFDSLPPDVQHELLLERQQVQKYSYHNPATLPQVCMQYTVGCGTAITALVCFCFYHCQKDRKSASCSVFIRPPFVSQYISAV